MKKKLTTLLAAAGTAALMAFGGMHAGAVENYYTGDVTLDDEVSVTDIILMQKYLLRMETLSQDALYLGDLDNNETVDIRDLALLKHGVLTGDWNFVYSYYETTTEAVTTTTTTTTTSAATTTATETTETTRRTRRSTESETTTTTAATTTSASSETTQTEATTTETTTTTVGTDFIKAPIEEVVGYLPSQGKANLVVLYVDFPDCRYDYEPTLEELTQYCFSADDGAGDSNYPFNSMHAFYNRASKGAMDLTGTVLRYTTKNNQSYYDESRETAAEEALSYYNSSVDFSQYDADGDGCIDTVLVSVPTAAGNDFWWPCAGPSGSEKRFDGKYIGHLITGNAQVKSSTDHRNFCSSYLHEMGHCMGLPDYYLYYDEDYEGFHGIENTAGLELMDVDASTDLCCFSKLMLGWYRQNQISVYDQRAGGTQTFTLHNAQTDDGDCLILPCGDLDSKYHSEYMIVEYFTNEGNNSAPIYDWFSSGNGIRVYHIKADLYFNGWWTSFKYENGGEMTNEDDAGIRLIRLANDAEGGDPFKTGDVIDGSISGFHWYDANENESVDTGYSISVGELKDGAYTVTVTQN
ncbi:MAG: hypothetical protein IJ825_00020 [Oscillospiraceae bacterium]|nr:hypothetical protein [Oscillospiraceae bacterium]